MKWNRIHAARKSFCKVIKSYSLNRKEWICSLFKEWILEKSEIRVNLEWTFVLFTNFGMTSGITQGFRVIPEVTPKWVNNTNVSLQIHSKFTLISLFSKIHSLKSEHIHSFLFREYTPCNCPVVVVRLPPMSRDRSWRDSIHIDPCWWCNTHHPLQST